MCGLDLLDHLVCAIRYCWCVVKIVWVLFLVEQIDQMEIELHDVAASVRELSTKKFKSSKEQLKLLQKEFVSYYCVVRT